MAAAARMAACCCGRIALEATGEPLVSLICNCADCRRRSGSAFGWSAYFPEANVRVTKGEPRTYQPARDGIEPRRFCPDCGSTLLWRDHRFPGHIGVAAGGLDPPVDAPLISNQDAERSDWFVLPATCAPRP